MTPQTVSILLAGLFLLGAGCQLPGKPDAELVSHSMRYARVVRPTPRNLVDDVAFLGFMQPAQMVNAHFLLPGRVTECRLREGDSVKVGDEICHLDDSAVRLEVVRAHNAVEGATKILQTNLLEKQKSLFEAGVIGQAEFEQVRVQTENANSQLQDATTLHEMALRKQKEHILFAPIEGRIARLMVKPGQPTSPEYPAAVLLNDTDMHVTINLHARFFSRVRVGLEGEILRFASERVEDPIPLKVVEKSWTVEPSTQTFKVVMQVAHEHRRDLATGLLVSGRIKLEVIENAYAIPQSSLFAWQPNGTARVFVVRDGILRLVDVKTGVLDDGWVQVLEGLSPEEDVVEEIGSDFVQGLNVALMRKTSTETEK